MPLSRCLKNELRQAKGPGAGTKAPQGTNSDSPGTTRQYKHTGKKYSGPNYPQKDMGVVGSGSLK